MKGFTERIAGDVAAKKRWREQQDRIAGLPPEYRGRVEALQRFLRVAGVVGDGEVVVALHEELVGAFEAAASQGVPPGDVVGGDPVAYAEALLARHSAGSWLDDERRRLAKAFA